MTAAAVPSNVDDPVNARILAIAEDRLSGFHREPFAEIAGRAGLSEDEVIVRLRALLECGAVRRIRQTLLATNLAPGALVAWSVPPERLDAAFSHMAQEDPFSGHVVLRSTDATSPGAAFRLWTTLKVPQGYRLERHARWLAGRVGAIDVRLMPARMLFSLGVGHVRRRTLEPGSRSEAPGQVTTVAVTQLSDLEWTILGALKREFTSAEIRPDPWASRAAEAGVSLDAFCSVADRLVAKGVIGRFSAFLEHVKPHADGTRVTRYNALFHWAVPPGLEEVAGRELGRHEIMTHAYWREAGPDFGNVNIMGVAHGTDKELLLRHKGAIDAHLAEAGIAVGYTNVFWGGRSEIKPSEILPSAYGEWCAREGIDPESMR